VSSSSTHRTDARAPAGGGRLDIVQITRFVAASVVVIAHAESRLVRSFPEHAASTYVFGIGDLRTWGHFGVDLFFVISGFIMFWVTRPLFGRPGAQAQFLLKRLLRVAPTYWLLTAVAVGLLVVAPGLFSYRGQSDPAWVLASLLFIPWQAPEGFVAPVIGLGWTLNFEVYFYLCFSIVLLLPANRALQTITATFVTCAILGTVAEIEAPWLRQGTSWLLVEFVLGLWIARLFTDAPLVFARVARWIGPVGAAMLVATIFFDPASHHGAHDNQGLRFALWGVPSAAILAWTLTWRLRPSDSGIGRALMRLGDASYSIYLVQVFTLPGFALVFKYFGLQHHISFDVLVVVLATCTTAAGYMFFAFVERPLTHTLQAKLGDARRRPRESEPAAIVTAS
jgi:peptidoglycan/LPS O-acetylase OafA/YrhL